MNWYYVDAGQQAGPITDEQLDELVRAGKVRGDTLVWREGMGNWEPYTKARPDGVAATAPIPPPPVTSGPSATSGGEVVCAECQQLFPRESTVQYGNVYVCPACKPKFVERLRAAGALPGGETELVYAGFWIRFVAKIIDGLIVSVLIGIPLGIIVFRSLMNAGSQQPNFYAVATAISWQVKLLSYALGAVFVGLFLGKFGATPGKMALGLKVVSPDGSKISYGRAFGRGFAEILTQLTCYLLGFGYWMAGFDPQKRALHDYIAGTRVIHTR
jgi:uncharacterized RDD family membrane protein YckC